MSGPVVLFAVNDFPPLLGGEAALYHGLARHLPPREVVLLAPRARGDAEVDAGLALEVVRRWLPRHGGTPSRVARGLIGAAHLGALLAARDVRYVLCGQLLSLGVAARPLARLRRIPYGLFLHGADLLDYHAHRLWGPLARWVISGADAVLVNSRFTARLLERLLPATARRVVVLPMGVDVPAAVEPETIRRLRGQYGLGDGPVLLSVARLVPMKGHDVAIDGLADLASRFPGLRYLIVGAGPHRAVLERRASQRGVAAHVVFAGRVRAADLSAHYRLATLFVQLSRRTDRYDGLEGFGLSLLEAASHGLPCIAGRSGGVPEAVQDGCTGLLVDAEDPRAFAAAAARLLSDPGERDRMGRAAQQWAASHTWQRSARCLLSAIAGM